MKNIDKSRLGMEIAATLYEFMDFETKTVKQSDFSKVARKVVKNCSIPAVVGQSEQFPCLNCGANSWKFIESLDKYRCCNCKRLKAK